MSGVREAILEVRLRSTLRYRRRAKRNIFWAGNDQPRSISGAIEMPNLLWVCRHLLGVVIRGL